MWFCNKKILSQTNCWDKIDKYLYLQQIYFYLSCGATRLGALKRPLCAYRHMLNLLTRFFPRRAYYAIVDAVRFALGSPFSVLFHAPSQHRQLSQNAVLHAYLLFVKGFIYPISVDYNARNCGCQQVLCFFTEFSGFSPSLTLLRPERMCLPACDFHCGEARDPLYSDRKSVV